MFDDSEKAKGHSLLVLDNSGNHFRAAIGSGDVDSADHVVVFTPGMTTTVDGGLVHTDTDPEKMGIQAALSLARKEFSQRANCHGGLMMIAWKAKVNRSCVI